MGQMIAGNSRTSITLGDTVFAWRSRTYIMGVLNVTPDSFSGDGTVRGDGWIEASVEQARRMMDEGADIVDVGGESTRPPSVYPDAAPVHASVEISRVVPVIARLITECGLPISIDTRKAEVADVALSSGAHMVNDVSTLADPEMARVVAEHGAPIVISHTRARAQYDDVVAEISDDLARAVDKALNAGVSPSNVIIDPGIGFAKNAHHSLTALKMLSDIKRNLNNLPMLVGASRKSFIGAILDAEPDDRVEGNAAATALAIAGGADMVRVHEVRAMARVAKVADAIVRGWDADLDTSSERVVRAVNRTE